MGVTIHCPHCDYEGTSDYAFASHMVSNHPETIEWVPLDGPFVADTGTRDDEFEDALLQAQVRYAEVLRALGDD